MILRLNTCMSLLLAVTLAHIHCKHTLGCMQKITQKNKLFLVTSIQFGMHNPVPSWYCRCCVGNWYKLLSVMHTHLPAYTPLSSSQGVDQCECDSFGHSQKSDECRIIGRTAQCVRESTSSCSCASGGWACVCVFNEVRGCCVAGLCTMCVHAGLNC